MSNSIRVKNARANNLKNISVDITKGKIYGICGVSGSGKSTLAYDVITKYALHAFSLSMPYSLQRAVSDTISPDVDAVEDVPPVIYIDIKNANRSIRSTVATTSGLMSILRNMFTYCARSDIANSDNRVYPRLFSYNIMSEEGGGACVSCCGTGISDTISPNDIFCDMNKSLFNGASSVINEKGIKYTKVSDLFLRAFCKEYSIDTEKKVGLYSEEEKQLLFYGSEKIINFTDRSGGDGGKKSLAFKGIIGELLDVYSRTRNANIEKIIIKGACCACHGTRYNSIAESYKIDGYSIADILKMSITNAKDCLEQFAGKYGDDILGYVNEFGVLAQELESIGVGYLELNREIASVSGGELQRVKLAKQIAMQMKGYCYVLDEPSTGLHNANILNLMKALNRLKQNGNTVLVVEHNPLILRACDELVELGPQGGNAGGKIVFCGTPEEMIAANTLTGQMLSKTIQNGINGKHSSLKYVSLCHVTYNNLKDVYLHIPLNEFVTVAGVSGSGKSSAINGALYEAVNDFILNGNCKYELTLDDEVKAIIRLDQNASVANSRSSVCTLLGLMDSIKAIYEKQASISNICMAKGAFSKNSEAGACPICKGIGYVVDDDKYEEQCSECGGSGYKEEVLNVLYKGYNIASLMSLSLDELIKVIDEQKICHILQNCIDIGLGYLSLERKSPSLSKGEYQRLRIASEISKKSFGKSIYLLDEPTKGLHHSDVSKVVNMLRKLVKEGNSVIAIEHNLDVILQSDYVIEFGPEAGEKGGLILFSGEPANIFEAVTPTAKAIKTNEIGNLCDSKSKEEKEYEIPFLNRQVIRIERNNINILKGYIATGKSCFLRDELYACSLKKYISCISTQGKYLTRDIYAIPAKGYSWPLTRLVSGAKDYFGKDERVVEALNLTNVIERMYAINNDGIGFSSSAFNAMKKTGKCPVCNGKGRFKCYDFEAVFSSKELEEKLIDLLNDRSRLDRISPLLKKDYGMDISRKYADMSEAEKHLFLYGDRKKIVYYAPKKKEYTWEGCNDFVFSNMSFADSRFQDSIRSTWSKRDCGYCNQLGIIKEIRKVEYKKIAFDDFTTMPIESLLSKLEMEAPLCDEEKRLIETFKTLVRYGLGKLNLYEYVDGLPVISRSILQFCAYCENHLADTIIAWDNFGAITDVDVKKEICKDLSHIVLRGVTVILVDNQWDNGQANIIECCKKRQFVNSEAMNRQNSHVYFIENMNELKNIEINASDSILNVTGVSANIREVYKKKYTKYLFSGIKEDEKCLKCKGRGYYEVNMGDTGFSKCECPDCCGTGFSYEINNCLINGKSIGEVLKLSVGEVIDWANSIKQTTIVEKLRIFDELNLGNVRISQKYSELSTNEAGLFKIVVQWCQTSEIVLDDKFLVNVDSDEKTYILDILEKKAEKYSKKIYMKVEA